MLIEADHVYVIAPATEMTIQGRTLRLVPRSKKVPHRPLDAFFCSLAEEREGAAIGVVLSGNDSDGALGLQAIRDAGGLTFAQDPESAKFAVMPRAAAAAADFVLPPAAIAHKLLQRFIAARDQERSATLANERLFALNDDLTTHN